MLHLVQPKITGQDLIDKVFSARYPAKDKVTFRDTTDKVFTKGQQAKFDFTKEEAFQGRFLTYCDSVLLMVNNWPELKGQKDIIVKEIEKFKNFLESDESHAISTANDLKYSLSLIRELVQKYSDIDEKTFNKYLEIAESLYSWQNRDDKVICTISKDREENILIVEIDEPISQLTEDQVKEFLSIYKVNPPEWFIELPSFAREYLLEKFDTFKAYSGMQDLPPGVSEEFNSIIHSLPSNLRWLPALANFTKHTCEVYDAKTGDLLLRNSNFSSATPVPINIKNKNDKERLALQNIYQYASQLGENKILYVQSLLTPLLGDKLVAKLTKEDNQDFARINSEAVAKFAVESDYAKKGGHAVYNILPINSMRKVPAPIAKESPKAKLTGTIELLKLFADFIDNIKVKNRPELLLDFDCGLIAQIKKDDFKGKLLPINNLSRLREQCNHVIVDLKHELEGAADAGMASEIREKILLFSSVVGIIDLNAEDKYKQLKKDENNFRAAYELILTNKSNGMGASSCKSGKDREGVVRLYVDTIISYTAIYNEIPLPSDTKNEPAKRERFINLFVDVFAKNHFAALASANSPYSFGLKSLGGVLPKDIKEAVEARFPGIFETHKNLSALNKVKPKKFDAKKLSDVLKAALTTGAATGLATSAVLSPLAGIPVGVAGAVVGATMSLMKKTDTSTKQMLGTFAKLPKGTQSSLDVPSLRADEEPELARTNTVKVSYDSLPQQYVMEGNTKKMSNSIEKIAEEMHIVLRKKEVAGEITYGLFNADTGLRVGLSIKEHFLSRVCADLNEANKCKVAFDSSKEEVKRIETYYQEDLKKLEETKTSKISFASAEEDEHLLMPRA